MNWDFIWNALPTWAWIVSLVAILVVFAFVYYSFIRVLNRKRPLVISSVVFVLVALSFLFNLMYVFVTIVAFYVVYILFLLYTNVGDFRRFFANPFKTSGVRGTHGVARLIDREALYEEIDKAVKSLSSSKTGAIITFERNTSLSDVMKNGVPVNAPVSSDLLLTIFYPGTRLHDGAVVIHDDEIVAASVFYTLSTRPFAVKYGSRHRAAIGISEISDAVTVVVSEETGRISIAANGQLDLVSSENFLNVFTNYMAAETTQN
ncbi:MAG: diadenylate cyclase [Coprobacillus sp.]|nr:diadenylate cyclase [Coprobacillus sp.]